MPGHAVHQERLGRILVVEDERIVALDLVTTLEELGYEVVASVATGEAAIARASETEPDVVLMDVRLSGEIDGIGAAAVIRRRWDTPVIYLTAHADAETLGRAKQTGPSGYLVKPFKAAELRCAIEIALHKHEIDGRLRKREQWLASTLRAIGDRAAAAAGRGAAPANPVAEALAALGDDDALGERLGDIMRPVSEPGPPPAPSAETRPHHGDGRRFDAELEHRVVERTAELEAANRELDAFSASVAHDLRAPLRHIDGFSQLLIEDHAANLGADGVDLLQRVRSATSHMTLLIEDLLRLSRVGKAAIARQRVDVSAMAWAVVRGLRAAHAGQPVQVSIADNMALDADPGLLRIVLENLLGNAWKYTARTAQPEVVIGVHDQVEPRSIFVRDNGVGFDAEHATTLFGAFQRFHAPSQFEGNGMGLAIVDRIIKRHGGRVWADSRPGDGATFYFAI